MDGIIFVAVFSLVMMLIQFLFPYKSQQNLDYSRLAENQDRFYRLEKQGVLWLFLSVLVITFLVYFLGKILVDRFSSDSHTYIMKVPNTYWFLPGIILGFAFVKVPLEFIYKLYLKDDFSLYKHYANDKHGFDGDKAWRPFAIILIVLGSVFFILGLNWFVRYDSSNQIEINEFFEWNTKTYQIKNIVTISLNKSLKSNMKEDEKMRHYSILMNDAYLWDSNTHRFFASQIDKDAITIEMEKLSTKAGIDIEENNTQVE